jgi:hypothetical protein
LRDRRYPVPRVAFASSIDSRLKVGDCELKHYIILRMAKSEMKTKQYNALMPLKY